MIKLGDQIKPFSHTPGVRSLVPRSNLVAQVFPTLLRILGAGDFPIQLTGPVKEFTVQLDLEKEALWIWGIAKEGHFRLRLQADETGLILFVDRAPKEGIQIGAHALHAKEKLLLVSGSLYCPASHKEKLSLGSFKSQDWDLVQRRTDPREFAPALFLLGQMTPFAEEASGGVAPLLQGNLELFFQAAFSDLLVPHLFDERHLGIAPSHIANGDPLSLPAMAYRRIRSYLILEQNPILRILPALPKNWEAGRAAHLCIDGLGEIDLEWSKNAIRRMVVRASHSCSPCIEFAKPVASYRLGKSRFCNGTEVRFEANRTYLFDRFEK